ncbi:TlpA family protein disulfide reductase [Mucilaginibacter lutimaris]|uniref:TlpA family protein disulfide reductase n=1 Tax=Mucilaginibacter lutimaris TaxID=931629 RepID=A0ABW2ZLZ7_9SPHI
MKLKICFPALLCLIFWFGMANAQGIKIGDRVPDLLITNIKGLRLEGKPVDRARLSDFSGKLLILDFWATWCAPCRRMMPVMDTLQRAFNGRVQFLSVTYEPERVAGPVLAAMQKIRPFELPEVFSDVALGRLFPHKYLPHYVWISGSGVLLATTEEKEVTAANIEKMLAGAGAALTVKRDSVVAYDAGLPLLVGGNGGDGRAFVYHSLLAGFKRGLTAGVSVSAFDAVKGQRFTARNVPLPWLCRLAFGENGRVFPPSRTLLLSRDSLSMDTRLSGADFEGWLDAGNGWTYELALPPQLAGFAYSFMQADLARLFPQYAVAVEKRHMRCLALVRSGDEDKLKSRGGELVVDINPYKATLQNAHLSQLMMRLERQYMQNNKLPLVDATGYTGRVDLELDAKLYDVADMNRALSPYGLAFKEQDQAVEVLVIADKPKPKS